MKFSREKPTKEKMKMYKVLANALHSVFMEAVNSLNKSTYLDKPINLPTESRCNVATTAIAYSLGKILYDLATHTGDNPHTLAIENFAEIKSRAFDVITSLEKENKKSKEND